MAKYIVSWTEEQWFTAEIEADSEEQARGMIFAASFEWPEPHGFEVQDSIEVEEIME